MRALLAVLVAVPLASAPIDIKVRIAQRDRTNVVMLPLEEYVAGVLAGEGGVLRSEEALKALAVASRTYAVRLRGRHSAEGFDFCDTTHCQHLDLGTVTPRLRSIAEETAGELRWFEGKPALAYYSRDCGGRTEEAGAMWPGLRAPYLRSRVDPYCARSGSSAWQWVATAEMLAGALRQSGLSAPRSIEKVAVSRRSTSGRAEIVALSGEGRSVSLSAGALRLALGRSAGWNTLRSDLYEVHSAGGRLVFQGLGTGHGVGLCQAGSEQMGLDGHSYREILAFYYPGTATGMTARGLAWSRLGGGDSVTVLTTGPGRDAAMLAMAERLSRLRPAKRGFKRRTRSRSVSIPTSRRFETPPVSPAGWRRAPPASGFRCSRPRSCAAGGRSSRPCVTNYCTCSWRAAPDRDCPSGFAKGWSDIWKTHSRHRPPRHAPRERAICARGKILPSPAAPISMRREEWRRWWIATAGARCSAGSIAGCRAS